MPDDTVSITVGDQQLTGWQRVSITRSLEQVPASFDLALTEKYPTSPEIAIKPGTPCLISIGSDPVITGYVDRYVASASPQDHTVRIQGRSMSEDLVDCAALFEVSQAPGGQMMGGTALDIARKLAAPYHVVVNSSVDSLPDCGQFDINLGETAWEVIERVTRFSKVVAYDLPDGSVLLARAGSEKMASGFQLGVNIESAEVMHSMDQRFYIYEAHFMSTVVLGSEWGPSGAPTVIDDEVPRKWRKRYVISEQTQLGVPLAEDRAKWEMNHRKGHSNVLSLTCDSWRDKDGKLWDLNHLAPIRCQQLKLVTDEWLIASVTYLRDENGQHANITMMHPIAFSPEPVALQNLPVIAPGVEGDPGANRNNPTAAENPREPNIRAIPKLV